MPACEFPASRGAGHRLPAVYRLLAEQTYDVPAANWRGLHWQ